MISDIVQISKRINKKEHIFLIFQSMLVFSVILFILAYFPRVLERVFQVRQATKDNVYALVCNLSHKKEAIEHFLENKDDEKLEDFYEWENNNKSFKYVAYRSGGFYSRDANIPDTFKIPYLFEDVENVYVYKLQVNSEFFKNFSIELSEGRIFNEEEYILSSHTIPVILGSKYKEIFKLGDKFKAELYEQDLECKIIGFLAENSFFYDADRVEDISKHIIFPAFNSVSDTFVIKKDHVNTDPERARSIFKMELNRDKTSGLMIYGDGYARESHDELQSLVNEKCDELQFYPEYSIGTNEAYSLLWKDADFNSQMWGIESEKLVTLLVSFIIIVVLISIICTSLNMATKILSLKRFYAILIANGVKKTTIYYSIIREVLSMNIPVIILGILSLVRVRFIIVMGLCVIYFLISLICVIYPCLVFKRINISESLRGDN